MIDAFDTPLSVAQAVAGRVKQRRLALRLILRGDKEYNAQGQRVK